MIHSLISPDQRGKGRRWPPIKEGSPTAASHMQREGPFSSSLSLAISFLSLSLSPLRRIPAVINDMLTP